MAKGAVCLPHGQAAVPGSRLGGIEERLVDLERTLTNRIRLLEESNTALSFKVKRLGRRPKKQRKK
jgi:hypothetical protein